MFTIRWKRLAILLLAAPVLTACGGDGSRGGGSTSPYGLESRPPLAQFDLPDRSISDYEYQLEPAFPDLPHLSTPLFLAGVPGQDRIAVLEKAGRIVVFDNDPQVSSATTVLDISSQIEDGGERGLLGMAFDPDFASNGYLYVHYTDNSGDSVIARFNWTQPNEIERSSESTVLQLDQPAHNHNAGMLAFGPDGYLYIAFGDGGEDRNTAQDTGNLLGKLLRVDVGGSGTSTGSCYRAGNYAIPADNPFTSDSQTCDEIWALGLRNPFRFSFDSANGDLWLGDVGWRSREEIDLITAGGNYGWPVYEGTLYHSDIANTLPDSAFTAPVVEYDHSQGVSVIGGYVYHGSSAPSLEGYYLYGDAYSGRVWALDYSGGQVRNNRLLLQDGNLSLYSFGEDNAGEVYLVSAGGTLYRLQQNASTPLPDQQLSETGLFTDLGTMTPASGLIEYQINAPFWSDGAFKRRWIGVPDGQRIAFDADGAWRFPVGTVLVKHFEMAMVEGDPNSRQRLETRVLTLSDRGWTGFTYRWNDSGTDAALLTGRETENLSIATGSGDVTFDYEYPSQGDCLACHTQAAGGALGVNTRQLNQPFDYPDATDNQLRTWNHIGLFDGDIGRPGQYAAHPDPEDSAAAVAGRARAYLDTNCAQCHRPDGPGGRADMDLRASVPTASMNVVDAVPNAGSLGISDARIVAPGDAESSVLLERMRRLDDDRMPPLGSHRVDTSGAELIRLWINGL